MANTRGRTSIHGPSATGTIKAGSITPNSAAPGVHGSGANSGNRTTINPGAKAPASGRAGNPISGKTPVTAGNKTTVGEGTKKPIVTSGKGIGSGTAYKRKKSRILGGAKGNTPA